MKRLIVGCIAFVSLVMAPAAFATDLVIHGNRVMIPIPRFLLPPSDALPDGVMYANPKDRYDEHRPRWRAEGWRDDGDEHGAQSRDRRDTRRGDEPGGWQDDSRHHRWARQDDEFDRRNGRAWRDERDRPFDRDYRRDDGDERGDPPRFSDDDGGADPDDRYRR
jgi:hypothetical protein